MKFCQDCGESFGGQVFRKRFCEHCRKRRRALSSRRWVERNPKRVRAPRDYKKENSKANPERIAVKNKVMIAIRSGRLRKEPCEVCGERRVDAHHDDYSKPLEVRWLCKKHHGEVHRKYV